MGPIDFLSALKQTGFHSTAIDLPFLLEANRRGILEPEEIEKAIPLVIDEVEKTGDARARLFLETLRDDPAVKILEQPVAKPPPKREKIEKLQARAAEALDSLGRSFPAAADAMRPWYEEMAAAAEALAGRSVSATADRQSLERRFRILTEAILAELDQQQIAAQQFASGLDLAVLAHVDRQEADWLLTTHSFFNAIGHIGKPGSALGAFELDALFIQAPLLSAAVAWGLDRLMLEYRVLELGPKTVVEIERLRGPVVIDTPQYASLGTVLRMPDRRAVGGKLVALPVGPDLVGSRRWQELMQSPLFATHPAQLVPSKLFWGGSYPETPPPQKQLSALVEMIFPAASLPQGQRLWAEPVLLKARGRYGIAIRSGAALGQGLTKNASLVLEIAKGTIAAAKIVIHGIDGGNDLAVVVDEGRLAELVAQATPKPPAESAPPGGERNTRFSLRRFSGVVDALANKPNSPPDSSAPLSSEEVSAEGTPTPTTTETNGAASSAAPSIVPFVMPLPLGS